MTNRKRNARPVRPLKEKESEKHDYEPGDTTSPMQSDPACRFCGEPKRSKDHR